MTEGATHYIYSHLLDLSRFLTEKTNSVIPLSFYILVLVVPSISFITLMSFPCSQMIL